MKRTILALGLVAILGTGALAGSISMTASQTATYDAEAGTLTVELEVSNSGDEAAYSVVPVMRIGETEVRGKRLDELAPKASASDVLQVSVGDLKDGRWPFSLRIDYADANQYPFQALQMSALTVGTPPPAKITVPKMEIEPIANTGSGTITVKNLSAEPRTATVIMHLPHGLEATKNGSTTVSLEGWAEETVTVELTNRTALAGSRYPVYAAVEYDDDDVHHALIAQAVAEIVSAENAVEVYGRGFWIAAAVLGGAFLLLLAVRVLRGQ